MREPILIIGAAFFIFGLIPLGIGQTFSVAYVALMLFGVATVLIGILATRSHG